MRVLVDTNVVLSFLQDREPFAENAARLFERIDSGEIEGFIAATTITNIYYIVRRVAGAEAAQDAILQVLTDLNICAVSLGFRDFEDAVQYVCGVMYGADAIVTRDATGFAIAEIPILMPEELDNLSDTE